MTSFLSVKHLIATKRISNEWKRKVEKDELWNKIFKDREPNELELLEFVKFHERKKFLQDSAYIQTLDQEELSEMLKTSNEIRSLVLVHLMTGQDELCNRKINVIHCWGDTLPVALLENPNIARDPSGLTSDEMDFGIVCVRTYVKYKESNEKATFIMQKLFQVFLDYNTDAND
jgi:hypothetical protein